MIYWIPYTKFYIETTKSREEIISILRKSTIIRRGTSNLNDLSLQEEEFIGEIEQNSFNITPILRYCRQGQAKIVIEGEIIKQHGKTKINAEIKLKTAIYIFMIIWLVAALFFTLLLSIVQITNPSISGQFLIPMSMMLLGYSLVTLLFILNAIKSKRLLLQLFK